MANMTPKILIVDDKPNNHQVYERILEPLDLDIVSAMSGQKALEVAHRHDFFLILMDVQMPDMDGFETATLVLDFPKTSHIPIIFITAIAKDEVFEFKGYESGAVDYLTKPINDGILRNKVRVFLKLHHQKVIIEKTNEELKKALTKIKTLSGFLPICASCKKIRDDKGYWNQIEQYIHDHSDAEFTHSICPDCFEKTFPR